MGLQILGLIILLFFGFNFVFAQEFGRDDIDYGGDEFIDVQPSPDIDNTNDNTEPSQSSSIGTQNTFARQSLFNRLIRMIGIVGAIGIVVFFIARGNKKRGK